MISSLFHICSIVRWPFIWCAAIVWEWFHNLVCSIAMLPNPMLPRTLSANQKASWNPPEIINFPPGLSHFKKLANNVSLSSICKIVSLKNMVDSSIHHRFSREKKNNHRKHFYELPWVDNIKSFVWIFNLGCVLNFEFHISFHTMLCLVRVSKIRQK